MAGGFSSLRRDRVQGAVVDGEGRNDNGGRGKMIGLLFITRSHLSRPERSTARYPSRHTRIHPLHTVIPTGAMNGSLPHSAPVYSPLASYHPDLSGQPLLTPLCTRAFTPCTLSSRPERSTARYPFLHMCIHPLHTVIPTRAINGSLPPYCTRVFTPCTLSSRPER